jgi:hypothetical protein
VLSTLQLKVSIASPTAGEKKQEPPVILLEFREVGSRKLN